MKSSEALLKIFYRPREVFAAQRQKQTWGRVFFILVALSLLDSTLIDLSSSWNSSDDEGKRADPAITMEKVESSGSVATTDAHIDTNVDVNSAARDVDHDSVPYGVQLVSALPQVSMVVLALLGFLLLFFIEALYLRIVSAILGLGLKLDHWLALVAWSHVPYQAVISLTTFVLVLTLFISSELLGFESNALVRLIQGPSWSDNSIYNFVGYWFLAELWVIALRLIGFRDWSGKGTLFSFVIAVVPTIFVYGLIWWVFSLN